MGNNEKAWASHRWSSSAPSRYSIALLVVLVAYALQLLTWPYIPPAPHLFFYPAVFVAARIGGARPGYLATAAATGLIAYQFLPPRGPFVESGREVLDLAIFAGVGIGISVALGRLRAALEREHAAAVAARQAKLSTDATWSMVVHDLRTPLSVINIGSTQLGGRRTLSPDMERTLGAIQRSTARARHLLDDALDAMRAAEGQLRVHPAECDTRELCEHAVDAVLLLANRKGVKLECDVSTRQHLMCDQPRLEQVLTNLLGNAIKFTPRKGVVSLYVDEGKGGLDFAVRDTGPGISPEQIASIFDKFWAGGSGGTGLGLWIACAILDAHGSRLAVDSRVGKGTTFRFTLPRVAGP